MSQVSAAKRSGAVRAGSASSVCLPAFGREAGQVLLLYAATLVLSSVIFPPLAAWPPRGLWPLAFFCLVPWVVATCRTRRAFLVHWLSFFLGIAFFLYNLRWLHPVTPLGYIALACYLAIYWPISAWALRTGQRHGICPAWTLPVVWVACELLRAWIMTGFPWLFLAHAFYAQLPLIQISDLVGAYGVSFVAATVNGSLAALVLCRWPPLGGRVFKRQAVASLIVAAGLLVATLGYGFYRCGQRDFAPGPRVAVVQHDFPLLSVPPYSEKGWMIFAEYLRLAAEAAAEAPDLLVFPETVWGATQNLSFLAVEKNVVEGLSPETWRYGKLCHDATAAFARGEYAAVNRIIDELQRYEDRWADRHLPRLPARSGKPVTVVVGATSVETFPEATYPKMKRYNSALVYDPDGTQRPQRYDKNHLVPFGEFVPFRYGRLHWLYRHLNALSPFSEGGKIEYSLSPGTELTVFTLQTPEGLTRFGTPICYEDVMPYVMRKYTWSGPQRRVDFLINISNDAWFLYGDELPQHLAICAFRAVENRVGIARAVNTGISGFVDPNGRIYSVVEEPGRQHGPGVIGYRVDRVWLDRRASFYGRTGDWFAGACLALTAILWAVAILERWVLNLQQHLSAWRAKGAGKHVDRPE